MNNNNDFIDQKQLDNDMKVFDAFSHPAADDSVIERMQSAVRSEVSDKLFGRKVLRYTAGLAAAASLAMGVLLWSLAGSGVATTSQTVSVSVLSNGIDGKLSLLSEKVEAATVVQAGLYNGGDGLTYGNIDGRLDEIADTLAN